MLWAEDSLWPAFPGISRVNGRFLWLNALIALMMIALVGSFLLLRYVLFARPETFHLNFHLLEGKSLWVLFQHLEAVVKCTVKMLPFCKAGSWGLQKGLCFILPGKREVRSESKIEIENFLLIVDFVLFPKSKESGILGHFQPENSIFTFQWRSLWPRSKQGLAEEHRAN